MNREQIEGFVMRYLETTGCRISEKGEGYVTVRLSPEADKDLMNRSYYWSFVERTGAPAEPMSFTFVFDPESRARASTQDKDTPPPKEDSILGRYFGAAPAVAHNSRVPSGAMTFGSRRLEQLFGTVASRGRFVRLFEEPKEAERNPFASLGYSTWLGVNFRVDFVCDMKRNELHSLGIHLATGQITEGFFDLVRHRPLTPRLPQGIHLEPISLELPEAVERLEAVLEAKISSCDHSWSDEAWRRLKEEWSRIDAYYGELLQTVEPGQKAEVEEQYRLREQEIDWQFRPRIMVSVMNCGLFHLADGLRTAIDASR